jgi:hypothetical protein
MHVLNPSIYDSVGPLDKFGSQVKTMSLAASSSSGKKSSCFSYYVTAKTKDWSEKHMRDLKAGDVVLVAPGTYSSVFMFTRNMLTEGARLFGFRQSMDLVYHYQYHITSI